MSTTNADQATDNQKTKGQIFKHIQTIRSVLLEHDLPSPYTSTVTFQGIRFTMLRFTK